MNLENLDALERGYVFCFWTGSNALDKDRATELFSILSNTHMPVVFLNAESYKKWELPSYPFHPALPYLSQVHKSDYLRAYFLHNYGGGYADIKFTFKTWDTKFDRLINSDAWMLGYTVPDATQVGLPPDYDKEEEMRFRADYLSFISNCAMIAKKRSPLTTEWYEKTCELLDQKLDLLIANPGTVPRDSAGISLDGNTQSKYPLAYEELVWIMTPIFYRHRAHILHDDLSPIHVFHMNVPIAGFQEAKKAYINEFCSIWPQL